MDILLKDPDPAAVAHVPEAREDHLAIGAMVFRDPLLDVLFVRIKLGRPGWAWFADHRFWMLEVFAHRCPRDVQFLSNLLHTLFLCVEIMYCIHGLTPKHGCSPEDLSLISFSLQPSWGLVNSPPARVYGSSSHLGKALL